MTTSCLDLAQTAGREGWCAVHERALRACAMGERDELRRQGESLCQWIGVLLTTLGVSTPEAAVEEVSRRLEERDGLRETNARLRVALEATERVIRDPEVSGLYVVAQAHGFKHSVEFMERATDAANQRARAMLWEAPRG